MSLEHANQISEWIGKETMEKYMRGQREHGGNLAKKNVLGHLTEELVDAIVYMAVLDEQMATIRWIANEGYLNTHEDNSEDAFLAIYRICEYGNEKGEFQEELTGGPEVRQFSEAYYKRISERVLEWLTK